MIGPAQSHSNTAETEQLMRLLELELIQKRATWKKARQRNRSIRSAAVVFVFLVVAACAFGFFFVFTRVSEQRPNRPAATARH
jgi:hypothetical protein